MQITQAVTTGEAGETDVDACSPTHSRDTMEALPEAHGRSSKQREPPENLQKEAMENDRGEAFGSGPTALRPSPQMRDPLLSPSPLLL